jgi:hypothetical protein
VRLLAIVGALAACHPRGPAPQAAAPPPRERAPSSDELTLYQDLAQVKQRVEIDVPPAGQTSVTVRVPSGRLGEIVVAEHDGLTVSALRGAQAPALPEIAFDVTGPPGRHVLYLGYTTDRIAWDAAYTMTTTPARRWGELRGALTIVNTTDVVFANARVTVDDAELGALTLGADRARIELLPGDPPRALRSTLIYDPIGSALDHDSGFPLRDPSLGAAPIAEAPVTEALAITRPPGRRAGLPGGPARLIARRADGTRAALGEARLFGAATRDAATDTVALGPARGVTGRRERRDFSIDDERRRLVEELELTLTNTRDAPVEVILREHLYRGKTWTIAYHSAPATKDGPQQISMRAQVPAHGETRVLYVVVYTWEPAQ